MEERDLEYRGINGASKANMMCVVSSEGSICVVWNRTSDERSILISTCLLSEQIDMRWKRKTVFELK